MLLFWRSWFVLGLFPTLLMLYEHDLRNALICLVSYVLISVSVRSIIRRIIIARWRREYPKRRDAFISSLRRDPEAAARAVGAHWEHGE